MATQSSGGTRFSIVLQDGVVTLRLRIRVRVCLALLAAIAAVSGSPALMAALARLLG
jgi:hypothetical protein